MEKTESVTAKHKRAVRLYLDPISDDWLQNEAARAGRSVSQVVRDLIEDRIVQKRKAGSEKSRGHQNSLNTLKALLRPEFVAELTAALEFPDPSFLKKTPTGRRVFIGGKKKLPGLSPGDVLPGGDLPSAEPELEGVDWESNPYLDDKFKNDPVVVTAALIREFQELDDSEDHPRFSFPFGTVDVSWKKALPILDLCVRDPHMKAFYYPVDLRFDLVGGPQGAGLDWWTKRVEEPPSWEQKRRERGGSVVQPASSKRFLVVGGPNPEYPPEDPNDDTGWLLGSVLPEPLTEEEAGAQTIDIDEDSERE